MSLSLSKEQKAEVIGSIRRFFREKLELELSELQAGFLLDYFFAEIAPFAYNEGVADAQKFLVRLCEGLAVHLFSRAANLLGPGRQVPESSSQTGSLSIVQVMQKRPNEALQPTALWRID